MRILYIVEVAVEYHWIILEWKKIQMQIQMQIQIQM